MGESIRSRAHSAAVMLRNAQLYRRQFSRPNSRWKTLDEIYLRRCVYSKLVKEKYWTRLNPTLRRETKENHKKYVNTIGNTK